MKNTPTRRRDPLTENQILNFRENLIGIQEEENISNKDLAEMLEVAPEYISKIRCGRCHPSARITSQLSQLLSVPEETLFLSPQERKYKTWAVYGKKVQKARIAKGLRATDIASFLGTTLDVYKELEEGKCSVSDTWTEKLDKLLFDFTENQKKVETSSIKPAIAPKQEKPVKAADGIPIDMIDIIVSHVRDLKVAPESQREIFRTLSEYKLRKQEEELFGKEA